jgi:MFS family permease
MYQAESSALLLKRRSFPRPKGLRVSRNVVLLGTVSFLTDVSSEMVATVLPLYVFFALGATPLQVGIVEGLYQGAAALVRLASGLVSDRWSKHREVAAVGYGLSAISKVALLAVGSAVSAVAAIVVVDRTGKGIRTAPRDALISLSSTRAGLASAFGVHRAMDTAGAMLGPLVAFGLLLIAPLQFDAIFVVSLCFGVLGLAVLVLFVENRPAAVERDREGQFSLRSAAGLLREPRFRTLFLVGGALALATVSDGLLYLGLQRRAGFEPTFFPLLFVGAAAAYMLLAVPVGRLADAVGRGKVLVGGYLLLLLVYTSLLLPSLGTPELVLYLLLFGAYYAATDGVLAALASAILPGELRATGLAFLQTVTGVGRLLSALAFGALWTLAGVEAAALAFMAALGAATLLAVVTLARSGARYG